MYLSRGTLLYWIALLVRSVIHTQTERNEREGLLWAECRWWDWRGGLELEGEIRVGWFEGICFSPSLKTLKFHSATRSCIVKLREAVRLLADFFTNWDFSQISSTSLTLPED